jgi:hypothetical protein
VLKVDAETSAKLKNMFSNLSSAGMVVEPNADPARAELAQIWELWGAGRPQTPGCVLDAAQEMERITTALRVKLAIAEQALDRFAPAANDRKRA